MVVDLGSSVADVIRYNVFKFINQSLSINEYHGCYSIDSLTIVESRVISASTPKILREK